MCKCEAHMTIGFRIFGKTMTTMTNIASSSPGLTIRYIKLTGSFDRDDLFGKTPDHMLLMVIGLDSSSNIPRSVQSDSATTCLLYEFASLLAAAASRLPESDALLSYCSIVTMYIVSTRESLRRS